MCVRACTLTEEGLFWSAPPFSSCGDIWLTSCSQLPQALSLSFPSPPPLIISSSLPPPPPPTSPSPPLYSSPPPPTLSPSFPLYIMSFCCVHKQNPPSAGSADQQPIGVQPDSINSAANSRALSLIMTDRQCVTSAPLPVTPAGVINTQCSLREQMKGSDTIK